MTGEPEQRDTLPASARRTLGTLERTLQRHLADLQQLDCEDIGAAEAIIFAMAAAENALTNARAVKRGLFDTAREAGPPPADNCD